jgi:hypothetical protein
MDFHIGLFVILIFNTNQKATIMSNSMLPFAEIMNIMKINHIKYIR